MISAIVAEELKVQIPKILSEYYVKNIINESVAGRFQEKKVNSHVRHELSQKEIYDQESATSNSKLTDRSNPMSFIYENVNAFEDEESHKTGIPLDQFDFSRHQQILMNESKGPVRETPEMKLRRIEENRRRLEVKI